MKKSSKYWLLGSIFIIVINLGIFIFKDYVEPTVLLWVVILTPAACLILYPMTRFLDADQKSRHGNGS